MRRRATALVLAALALTVPLAGCGGDDEPSDEPAAPSESTEPTGGAGTGTEAQAPVEAAKVDIREFAYEPVTVTVRAGGTVEWVNADAAPHTATADDGSFDTGSLAKGDKGKVTLDKAGTFSYICTFHPFMNATVEVVE
jgi:plastocyanin